MARRALEIDLSLEGAQNGATIRGSRNGEEQFRTLPVPTEFWGDIDTSRPYTTQMFEMFTTHSVGTRHFIDAILADKPVSPNFYDGLKAQEVIDVALESSRLGSWVGVPPG